MVVLVVDGAQRSAQEGRPTVSQYVPEVGHEDVERILRRDFPVEAQDELRQLIEVVEVGEKDRVVLACMKNAAGDVQELKGNLAEASGYYREIIGEAEYPNYLKKMFRIDRLSEDEKAKIIEKDKIQYLKWLTRGTS